MSDPGVFHLNLSVYFGDRLCNQMIIIYFSLARRQDSKHKITDMIRHTVAFKLIHPKNSQEEKVFLDAISKLSAIPGVEGFQLLRQTSRKNSFDFGLSMEFETAKAYEGYNQHPDHVAFVSDIWIPEVSDFLELDYESLV